MHCFSIYQNQSPKPPPLTPPHSTTNLLETIQTFKSLQDGTFETIDTDGDGGISPDELAEGLDISLLIANRYVVAFDANRDGELDSKGKTETKIHIR